MLIKTLPANIDLNTVDIWSQDETRIGQQGSRCRIWAKQGTRPRKVKQQQFISTYIYAAACHTSGQSCALILPYANTTAMNLFLTQLSISIKPGRHVALIVDNAGWHKSADLILPHNITFIPLPAYSPELNAMEQVWQWIKATFLSHQYYSGYTHILDKVSQAWNIFSSNLELVKSIMFRTWINLPPN